MGRSWPTFWGCDSNSNLIFRALSAFQSLSHVRLCATPWTAAHQAALSLGFSRREHWNGLPFPSPTHESESEVTQSCPTLCDAVDFSPPASSVHEIFQARVLEWVANAFSGLYSLQDCTVRYTAAQPLVENAQIWQCTPDLWSNLQGWTCEHTLASLKACNLKVCNVEDLLYYSLLQYSTICRLC